MDSDELSTNSLAIFIDGETGELAIDFDTEGSPIKQGELLGSLVKGSMNPIIFKCLAGNILTHSEDLFESFEEQQEFFKNVAIGWKKTLGPEGRGVPVIHPTEVM